MLDLSLRVLALCIALAAAETLHGIARMLWLVPRVGKGRAQKISIVTGTLLAFSVCWLAVPSFALSGASNLIALGFALSSFMAAFDVFIAKVVARRPWPAVRADFDPRRGNYLVFGLIILVGIPDVVMLLHRAP